MNIVKGFNCSKECERTGGNQRYCKKCALIIKKRRCTIRSAMRHKNIYKKHPKLFYLRICLLCGKRIKAASTRQKFCKKCSIINQREYQKRYNKVYRSTKVGKSAYKRLNNVRRAKMNSIQEDFTMDEWFRKVDKTKGVCSGYERDAHFVGKDKLTIDHTPQISKAAIGFIYKIDNITPLCRSCNSRKGTK